MESRDREFKIKHVEQLCCMARPVCLVLACAQTPAYRLVLTRLLGKVFTVPPLSQVCLLSQLDTLVGLAWANQDKGPMTGAILLPMRPVALKLLLACSSLWCFPALFQAISH